MVRKHTLFLTACVLGIVFPKSFNISKAKNGMFRKEQIIFSSDNNITSILAPADGNKYIQIGMSEMPSVFFTVSDPKLKGGSCIYVLEGFTAFEILEGGRDSTADYSFDHNVYFGAKDGIYKYYADSLSAKKYSKFYDDVIQLQKANGTDEIFFLTAEHKIYKLVKNGTVRQRIQNIICALQFVLDTSNNLYYVDCSDNMPHIIKNNGHRLGITPSVLDEFKKIKLLRPAFIMDNCIPFFGDDALYILHANGTSEKKEFVLKERPSAISIDASLYLVAAMNGKIYEFNVMDMLVRSMFGVNSDWPQDVTKIVTSVIEGARESIYGRNRDWNIF